jgi:geranylgeranylglycerol-phosphate geranylgeranyltransferase
MIGDWVKLARLSNALVAGLGVWLGHACLPGPMDWTAAALGSLALALLAAAGNMHNDVLDLKVDRINRPDRPLPSGRIAPSSASRAAIILYLAAIGLAFRLGAYAGLLTAGMALLLCLYNLKLKGLPLWGNIAVAALCALAIYLPEFPEIPVRTGLPALFAFLTTLAREITKDAEDIAGDSAVGWKTFPIRYGEKAARIAVMLLSVLVLLMLPLPYLWLDYHAGYVLVALIAVVPLLIAMLFRLSRAAPDWKRIQKLCKWVMLAGMAAIFIGIYF